MQPRPGWRERLKERPRPGQDELCHRLRLGDFLALEWIEQPFPGLRELYATIPEDFAGRILDIEEAATWSDLWQSYPNLRHELVSRPDRMTPAELASFVEQTLADNNSPWREQAAFLAQHSGLKLKDCLLSALDHSNDDELELWLTHQAPAQLLEDSRYRLAVLNRLLQRSKLPECVGPLHGLKEHQDKRVRWLALRCLAQWHELDRESLVAVASDGLREALTALEETYPDCAEAVALQVLDTQPWLALPVLQRRGNRAGLPLCRARALDLPQICARYLDVLGEDDEEMLESLHCSAAARALINRGHLEYWDYFRQQIRSDDFELAWEELLDWGSDEALQMLLPGPDRRDQLESIASCLGQGCHAAVARAKEWLKCTQGSDVQ